MGLDYYRCCWIIVDISMSILIFMGLLLSGLSFLGCGQVFHLKDKVDYVEANPDKKKCFWAGKKVFYLKKYDGELIFQK